MNPSLAHGFVDSRISALCAKGSIFSSLPVELIRLIQGFLNTICVFNKSFYLGCQAMSMINTQLFIQIMDDGILIRSIDRDFQIIGHHFSHCINNLSSISCCHFVLNNPNSMKWSVGDRLIGDSETLLTSNGYIIGTKCDDFKDYILAGVNYEESSRFTLSNMHESSNFGRYDPKWTSKIPVIANTIGYSSSWQILMQDDMPFLMSNLNSSVVLAPMTPY